MESWHRNRLSANQAGLLESWLPGVLLLKDLSWNLVDTAVLEVADDHHKYIVKAAGPLNHHIGREIQAHVEGTEAEYDTETYQQAGRLMRAFHEQAAQTDPDYEAAAASKTLSWLSTPHRIESSSVEKVQAILGAYQPKPVVLVPTHGDWQPRNWLVDETELRIIDFGRYGFRPAATDFCRLAVQQWRSHPHLETAFFEGYGSDPRDGELWNVALLREAVATAAWAYQTGHQRFEEQGHRMLRDALAKF
ncbi:phosphotransferase [Micrococcaceae bacterium Sec5.1]